MKITKKRIPDEIKIVRFMDTRRAGNDNGNCHDFDDLVLRASSGDRRAVGAIAIALGSSLLDEARRMLEGRDEEAADVLREFLHFLLEARGPFNRTRGPALEWMFRMVETIARQRRERVRRL